jgi:hypothetical protein
MGKRYEKKERGKERWSPEREGKREKEEEGETGRRKVSRIISDM